MNDKHFSTAFLALCVMVGGCGQSGDAKISTDSLESDSADPQEVEAALVAGVTSIQPGEPFTLAVRFTIPREAHIYWRHPGSSGLATDVAWEFPDGFAAGPLEWPAPKRFEFSEIDDISYGYEEEVYLFSEVTAPDALPADSLFELAANVFWLVCLDDGQCIPGEVALSIGLHSGDGQPSESHAAIARARDDVPTDYGDGSDLVSIDVSEEGILSVEPSGSWRFSSEEAGFFPYEGPAWNLIPGNGPERVTFKRKADGTGGAAGVLSVVLARAESGETRTLHLRVGIAP